MSPEQAAGCRIRDLRKARGWSQDGLAARAGAAGFRLHQTQLSKIESGDRPLRLNEAATLAAVLGVTLVDLLAGIPPAMAASDPYGDGYRAGRADAALRMRAALNFIEEPADA